MTGSDRNSYFRWIPCNNCAPAPKPKQGNGALHCNKSRYYVPDVRLPKNRDKYGMHSSSRCSAPPPATRPSRYDKRFPGGDCSALGGESTLLAPILLAADRGVQVERIGGRGAQSGDGRTLISRRSRHRFRGVIRFTGGFVSKSYFDADRFFAFIGEAARQGGRRSGHIRRSDGTELRLGIFTRFQGRELCDGARITLVADNDIRIKSYFVSGSSPFSS